MKRIFLGAATAAFAFLSIAQSIAADKPSLVGKWHWNPAQSSAMADGPPPKDVLLDIASANDKLVQWTVTAMDDKGTSHVISFNGPPNANPKPLQGSQDGSTAVFAVVEGAMKVTFKSPGGDSDVQDCSMSTDGRKLTCRGTILFKDGKSANYIDVYDRLLPAKAG